MRRGRTFWAQLTLSTQRALLRLLERKAKDNSNKYNNARVAGVRVGGRQRDPVLSQSRAYQEALVRTGFKEERPRPPSRSAIIPVACSDGPPGTWSWSLCCLRPEDAGTSQGMEQASRNIGCRYRVNPWMARGQCEPQIVPTGSWPTAANPLMTCADHAA